MTEVLVEFETITIGPDGKRWTPRVCGRVADDGLWEGWIEFTPVDQDSAASPLRTPRETEQPNRADLLYWAQGLTQVYLDDALRRAIERPAPIRHTTSTRPPHFDGPAPPFRGASGGTMRRPVLNPFEVYQQGEELLLQQLSALDTARLREIVVAYGFANESASADAGREELTTRIVAATRGAIEPRDFRT